MLAFTRFALRNPGAVVMLVLLALGAGIFAAGGLPIEIMPNIGTPSVQIVTTYPGASAPQVVNAISLPMENSLHGITGIQHVDSLSQPGVSIVNVQFDLSQDLSAANQAVQAAVAGVNLPQGAGRPAIQQKSYFNIPAIQLLVRGPDAYDIGRVTQSQLVPLLSGLAGVGNVQMYGNPKSEVLVDLQPAKLAAAGVALGSVEAALGSSSINQPVGTVPLSGGDVPTVVQSGLSAAQLGNLEVVGTHGPVVLSSLGTIVVTSQGQGDVLSAGKPAALVNVGLGAGANTVQVSQEVIQKLPELRSQLPPGYSLTVMWNSSNMIESSVQSMEHELALGVLFSVLIIFLFLRNLRSTIVAAVSIPVSVLVTLFVLKEAGYTLNLMTLGGLAVAVGRVVDDSIVVIENLYRKFQGAKPGELPVVEGTGEVARAITSSTLTTVAVFAPLAFVSGLIGKVFLPFALSVVVSLVASLFVALMVVPLFSRAMSNKRPPAPERPSRLAGTYKQILSWSLSHRALTLILAGVAFFASLGLATRLQTTFLPNSGPTTLTVNLTLPVSSSGAKTRQTLLSLEKVVAANSSVAKEAAFFGSALGSTDNVGEIYVVLKTGTDGSAVQTNLQSALKKMAGPGVTLDVTGTSSSGGSNTFAVQLLGQDAGALAAPSQKIEAILKNTSGLANVTNDLALKAPTITVQVDPSAAAAKGLDPRTVATQLQAFFSGLPVGTVDVGGQNVPLVLSVPTDPKDLQAVQNTLLMSPTGAVPLSQVAKVTMAPSVVSVNRQDGESVATLSADVTSQDLGGVSKAAMKKIDAVKLPTGVKLEVGGSSQQMSTAFSQMGLAMLAAILIVYVIMVVTFGGMLAPLSILLSLPLAVIGAVLGLLVSRNPLGMPAMIGLLMLIGIVVTNAIVLVDLVQQKQKAGVDLRTSLLEAGATRLRPILMTAFTSIFALLPLALGYGNGLIISSSLAAVVIGGLLTSTLLTLVVVPVALSVLTGGRSRAKVASVSV